MRDIQKILRTPLIAFLGGIALLITTSLIIQNIYALSGVREDTEFASHISIDLNPLSMVSSLALRIFDDTSNTEQNTPRDLSQIIPVSSQADPTKKVITDFRYYNGFKFPNRYVTEATILSDKYIPDFIKDGDLTFKINGRCGGMAYAALDYWYAHKMIPGYTDLPSNDVPISNYIFHRFYDSLDFPYSGVNKNALLSIYNSLSGLVASALPFVGVDDMEEVPKFIFYSWTKDNKWGCKCVLGVCTPCIPGVRDSTNKEIPTVTRSLDQGKPVVLGLISARSLSQLGNNHQVVAYGYEYFQNEKTYLLYIYDPNYPNTEPVLVWNQKYGFLNERSERYSPTFDNPPTLKTWRGFFVMDYEPVTPPDIFIDIDYDGVVDSQDNCPTKANSDQKDTNNNGVGDVCESGDIDNDGITDSEDNCKWAANPDQKDENNDGVGDACKDVIL